MKKRIGKYFIVTALLFVGAVVWVVLSPGMRVSSVFISGNDRVSREEIAEIMPFSTGDHMLFIPMRVTKELLKSDPRIAWADIRRKPKGLVEVSIGEEYPSLLLSADRIWGLTESGMVLPFYESYEIPNLIVLSCAGLDDAIAPYKRIDSGSIEDGIEFYKTIRDVSPRFLDRISEIHIKEDDEIIAILTGDGLKVEFGNNDPKQRLMRLASVLDHLGMDRADVSSIDLRYSDQAIVQRIRESGEKALGELCRKYTSG